MKQGDAGGGGRPIWSAGEVSYVQLSLAGEVPYSSPRGRDGIALCDGTVPAWPDGPQRIIVSCNMEMFYAIFHA